MAFASSMVNTDAPSRYKLDAARKWEKLAVEGSLFVFERTQQPLWGFHILNQQSTENFHQPITMGMKVEHKKPFLIYKANDGLSTFCPHPPLPP